MGDLSRDMMIQSGPCTMCGATNYPLSFGGPGICPACDCYGVCKRCKILIAEINLLKEALKEKETLKENTSHECPYKTDCIDCDYYKALSTSWVCELGYKK